MAFDITQLPQEAVQKLKNLFLYGAKGQAPQQPVAQGNVPTNPDLNPDYQREPGGLLKRGAATPGTQPSPTDATQQQGTPAPTLTPSTPQGQQPVPTTGGTAPKPQLTDAQWAQQNPGAAPAPPTPFTPPSWKTNLRERLAHGMMEFGRPGTGIRAAEQQAQQEEAAKQKAATDQQNYPQTLHAAREKDAMAQADLANKQATTEHLQKETANIGQPPEDKTDQLEILRKQYVTQSQAGDENGAKVTLDMLNRLYPEQYKQADAAEMAKIPPQVLAQVGTKPTTPVYAPPGQPPKTFNSTQEAQAAWGQAITATTEKAAVDEAKQKKAAEVSVTPPDTKLSAQERVQVERETRTAVRKADGEYRNAAATADMQKQFIQEAKSGNKEAVRIIPLEGALEITTSQGTRRINRTEVEQYGSAGSYYDKLMGKIGSGLTGKSITDEVLNDVGKMTEEVEKNAYKKYADTYDDEMGIAQGYGLNLASKLPKIQGQQAPPAAAPHAGGPAAPPAGNQNDPLGIR